MMDIYDFAFQKLKKHVQEINDYLILLIADDRKIKPFELRRFTYKPETEIWCNEKKIR